MTDLSKQHRVDFFIREVPDQDSIVLDEPAHQGFDEDDFLLQTLDYHGTNESIDLQRVYKAEKYISPEEYKYDTDLAASVLPQYNRRKLSDRSFLLGGDHIKQPTFDDIPRTAQENLKARLKLLHNPPQAGSTEEEINEYLQQQVTEQGKIYKEWWEHNKTKQFAWHPGILHSYEDVEFKRDDEPSDHRITSGEGTYGGMKMIYDPDQWHGFNEIPSHVLRYQQRDLKAKEFERFRDDQLRRFKQTNPDATEEQIAHFMKEQEEWEYAWWSFGGQFEYTMPHQSLHGGITTSDSLTHEIDKEEDVPLNSYFHKSSLSPQNWFLLKERFRNAANIGSTQWNETAYRNEMEKDYSRYLPKVFETWFVRNDIDLLDCHHFRCKLMDHSAVEEFWRLGQMRWNRKNWLPWVRVTNWVIMPIVFLYVYNEFAWLDGFGIGGIGHPERYERSKKELLRWRQYMKSGGEQYGEYFVGTLGHDRLKKIEYSLNSFNSTLPVDDLTRGWERNAFTQYERMVQDTTEFDSVTGVYV